MCLYLSCSHWQRLGQGTGDGNWLIFRTTAWLVQSLPTLAGTGRFLLGDSGGVDSEFANFTLQTLKAFLEARSHNVSGNKQ